MVFLTQFGGEGRKKIDITAPELHKLTSAIDNKLNETENININTVVSEYSNKNINNSDLDNDNLT